MLCAALIVHIGKQIPSRPLSALRCPVVADTAVADNRRVRKVALRDG